MLHNVIICVAQKGGVFLSADKKLGRPTDSPKINMIRARVNDSTLQILDEYCKENNKNRAEGIRDGIGLLKDKLKK